MNQLALVDVATDIPPDGRVRVKYNSSRSDDVQEVEGEVLWVKIRRYDESKIVFQRDDGQKMEVQSGDGRLLSYGSHAPTTGFAFEVEVL
jgi:hypothetical protein